MPTTWAAGLSPEMERAIWEGDVDKLDELAPCGCCCWEHTSSGCPARAWGACRGQGTMTEEDVTSWVRHYALHHGLSEAEFYGAERDPLAQVAADAVRAYPYLQERA